MSKIKENKACFLKRFRTLSHAVFVKITYKNEYFYKQKMKNASKNGF